jgi:hypothetical protein
MTQDGGHEGKQGCAESKPHDSVDQSLDLVSIETHKGRGLTGRDEERQLGAANDL